MSLDLADIDRGVILSDQGFGAWCETYGHIRLKSGKLVPLKLNKLQARVARAVEYALANDEPLRLVLLKPRQKGCSTISVAFLYYMLRRFGVSCVIIGGQDSQVGNLWSMIRTYAAQDTFDWGNSIKVGEKDVKCTNGGWVQRETAGDKEAGRSGTFQFLIATEAARWKAGTETVLSGIKNCVPTLPHTVVILESTASGPTGDFYSHWDKGLDLDHLLDGLPIPRAWNRYIRIFSPWYEHDDSKLKLAERERHEILNTLDDYEREMLTLYPIGPEHIAWYRYILLSECEGDLARMQREFPSTPAEAFNASQRCRFSKIGLRIIRDGAILDDPHKTQGTLDGDTQGRAFTLAPSEPQSARVIVFEAPMAGRAYCMGVDVMTGELAEGKDPDHHTAAVIRVGYFDDRGAWIPPKLAARLAHPCRWDIDVLAEWIYRLSVYYGHCTIAPEINWDRGLTTLLRIAGANLYVRTADNEHSDVRSPSATKKHGWRTTQNSRNFLIENLARAIREYDLDGSGLNIPCMETVRELEQFIVWDDGKAQAAVGKHDDLVMSLAIALGIQSSATTYTPPRRHVSHSDPMFREISRREGLRRRSAFS